MRKPPEKTVGCSNNVVWALLVVLVLGALLNAVNTRAATAETHTVTLPLIYNRYEPDPMCWIMDR